MWQLGRGEVEPAPSPIVVQVLIQMPKVSHEQHCTLYGRFTYNHCYFQFRAQGFTNLFSVFLQCSFFILEFPLASLCLLTSLCPIPIQKLYTNLLCSCARGLVGEWRRTSSTACSRWKVAVPAHTRYTAPEPLSTGQSKLPNRWAHSAEGIWICREFGCDRR